MKILRAGFFSLVVAALLSDQTTNAAASCAGLTRR
jgi:hypothetical protein